MSNIPEQNPPINNPSDKISYLAWWIISGLATIILAGFSYYLNRLDNKLDHLESKYQVDHDKIIKLETIIETFKK